MDAPVADAEPFDVELLKALDRFCTGIRSKRKRDAVLLQPMRLLVSEVAPANTADKKGCQDRHPEHARRQQARSSTRDLHCDLVASVEPGGS
jgi:hypothetical protein